MSKEEYLAITVPAAETIAQVEGCLWKIWLMNEETQQAGGVYLFENVETANAYLAGPLVGKLASHPGLSDISVHLSGYVEEPTLVTRGPVQNLVM